jgi:hypothetical protein
MIINKNIGNWNKPNSTHIDDIIYQLYVNGNSTTGKFIGLQQISFLIVIEHEETVYYKMYSYLKKKALNIIRKEKLEKLQNIIK